MTALLHSHHPFCCLQIHPPWRSVLRQHTWSGWRCGGSLWQQRLYGMFDVGWKISPLSTAWMDIGNISLVSDCITAVDGTEAHLFQNKVLWIVLESWITSGSRGSASVNRRATAPPNDGRRDYMSPSSPWRTAGCLRGHTYAPAVIRHARTHLALHCPTLRESAAPTQTLPHTDKYAYVTHVHSSTKDVIANKSRRPPTSHPQRTDSVFKQILRPKVMWCWSNQPHSCCTERKRAQNQMHFGFPSDQCGEKLPFSALIKVPSCYSLIKRQRHDLHRSCKTYKSNA